MYIGKFSLVKWFKDVPVNVMDFVSQLGLLRTKADIAGSIIEIRPCAKNDVLAEIVIESGVNQSTAKTLISVKHETTLFEQCENKIQRVSFQMLKVGQHVKVWFPALILAPLFGSAMAQDILIVE